MPINRNVLLRYKTIDQLLRGGRQASLDELIYELSFQWCKGKYILSLPFTIIAHSSRYNKVCVGYSPYST